MHHVTTSPTPPAKEIARGIVAIYKEYLGRGPSLARSSITDEYVVTVLSDGLTKAERTLVEQGEAETVREIRRKFQEAMRPDICALVEQTTGRKVRSFMSDHDIEADDAVEFVYFEPDEEQLT